MTLSSDIPSPSVFPHILVVQASAGAGKTYSLGLRFLQLLARTRTPSPGALGGILALTFTVAAAQEMKSRIIAFLKNIALRTETGKELSRQSGLGPEAAQAWLDCILEHFQRFQVKTIDSLHFQLVQALGRRMNLWPDLEASFDQAGWARMVLEGLLARTDWDQSLDPEGLPVKIDELLCLWEEIFNVYLHLELRSGMRFLSWLENQAENVVRGLDQLLVPLGCTSLDDLRAAEEEFLRHCRDLARILERANLQDQVKLFKPLEILTAPLAKLESAFFTKDLPEELFKKNFLGLDAIAEAWSAYASVRQARNTYLLARSRLQVAPLTRLQHLVMCELERLGQSQGLLLGGWWTRLIRQHLADDGLLQEAEMILGAQWRHLLIDEFQDTSREQWEVLRELALEALSEGGSLFCVGDVKQAIYGWRGGDWRLFFDPLSPAVFPNVAPENRMRAVLPFNRRSCPELVEWNNACFASLDQPDPNRDLAAAMIRAKDRDQARDRLGATIARLYAAAAQTPWKQCAGSIRITDIRAETAEDYKAKSLRILAEEVTASSAQGTCLGDIAVLVRTNAETGECAKTLLAAGIPTITEQSLRISGHPIVRGLLALLTWLDNPGDDAALYALCCNPHLLPDAPDLDLLAPPLTNADPTGSPEDRRQPLYQRLQQEHPAFWDAHLRPFREFAGFAGAYELLLAATTHFQLRELPLGQWAWVEKFLESACNAEAEGAVTLSAFLDFWRKNGSSCVVGLPEGLAAVRVLTMHKAKGLEFPRVILPLLGYDKKNRSSHVLLFSALGEPFLASTARPRADEVAEVMDQEQIKNLTEELNLLYVALTRAKEELHLFLAETQTAKSPQAADWLRTLMPRAPVWSDRA